MTPEEEDRKILRAIEKDLDRIAHSLEAMPANEDWETMKNALEAIAGALSSK